MAGRSKTVHNELIRIKAHALLPIHDPRDCAAHKGHDQQPLGNRGSPGHDDPFLNDEFDIDRALAKRAAQQSGKILAIYDPVFDSQFFDGDMFEEATMEAEREWESTWNAATASLVGGAILSSLNKGEAHVSVGIIRGTPSRQAVLDGMTDAAKFYTNGFFTSQVLPALQRKVQQVLDGTPIMGVPDLTSIRGVLDARLRSVPYWRVVANSAASRSYHYGILKAAQFQGRTGYAYVAVIDDVTTVMCEDLNGREWWVADAVNLVERVAAADNIDEVKNLTPWLPARDVVGKTNDELVTLGVIVPPIHGNCRSTIRIL